MRKHVLFALAFAGLAIAAWQVKIAIWFLFTLLSAYHLFSAWRLSSRDVAPDRVRPKTKEDETLSFGVLGTYAPERDDASGERFGLYLKMGKYPVFVDIREDKFIEERKKRALFLAEHSQELEVNLHAFVESYPEFASRVLRDIGLHSNDVERGEVFWDPEGYTLLRGLKFELE